MLYDHLVSTEILDLVRRDADKVCVGKRAGNHSVSQEETNQLIVNYARQKVVRLKVGIRLFLVVVVKSCKLLPKPTFLFKLYPASLLLLVRRLMRGSR